VGKREERHGPSNSYQNGEGGLSHGRSRGKIYVTKEVEDMNATLTPYVRWEKGKNKRVHHGVGGVLSMPTVVVRRGGNRKKITRETRG